MLAQKSLAQRAETRPGNLLLGKVLGVAARAEEGLRARLDVLGKGVDSDGDLKLVDAVQTGVLAIAKALEVNGVLTTLDLRANNLGDEAKGVIRDAVSGRKGFKLEM